MIRNLIGAEWVASAAAERLPVYDPATAEVIDEVPLSNAAEVGRAAEAARRAFASWSRTPVMDRAALLFRYKALLEQHAEELARIVTRHHGKTLDEARGEVRRGIEVVDFACGIPTLLQGRTLRQVSAGVDQDLYRFPVGVVAGITPFNFPVMIPLWMFPLAIAAGNTFVLKPSERTPLGAVRLAEIFLEAGFPEGVLNVVHGAREVVDALLAHPAIRAISFVGSEPVARHVYAEAARNQKRVQAAGGAKNHIVVLPDADLDQAVPAILNSAFGNAGERCVAEGAHLVTDGRSEQRRAGFFLGPTVLDDVGDAMVVGREEIFGPVLSVGRADTLDGAIAQANRLAFGNMAVLFTQSGRAAREFRERVEAGMVGVNVGVAQPFAFYPFSGWKGSFYGDLHIHGTDGIDFYTRKKVVVS